MSSLVHTSFAFILKYCDKNIINLFFSVTCLPCLSYRAQTCHLMSGFSPHVAAQWKLSASSSSSSPTFTFSSQSKDPFFHRKEGDLLYLCFPPDIRGHLPGDSALRLLTTHLPVFPQHW